MQRRSLKTLGSILPLALAGLAFLQQPAFGGPGFWTPVGPDGGDTSLVASPADPQRVWAATGGGAWLTLDGGLHWEQRSLGLDPAHYVFLLVPDPRSADVAYVVENPFIVPGPSQIFRTFDAGLHWSPLLPPPGVVMISGLSVDPFDSRILLLGTDRGFFRSMDLGLTWTRIDQGLPPTATGSIVPDPRIRGTLFVSLLLPRPADKCGWARSTNGGDLWTLESTSFCPTRFLFSPSSPGVVFAQANGDAWRSNDEGASWIQLAPKGFNAGPWAIDPTQPNTLYTASPVGLLRSTDAGRAWQPVGPLRASDSVTVAGDGSAVWAGGTQCQAAFCGPLLSMDHGTTWSLRASGLVVAPTLSVWPDRLDPLHILLGFPGLFQVASAAVMSTTDGGHTWSGSTGIQPPPSFGGPTYMVFDQAMGSPGFFSANVAFEGMAGLVTGLYRSFDGGLTWPVWDESVVIPLAFQPARPGRILGARG
ncbi:MAG: hypothetical protein JOZ15_08065, partial [Acidobacteria bacterium]|nr:hypothetical protein [Acidobacteriota bacterium]